MLVETGLHQQYGLDLAQPGLMQQRDWRWLQVRLAALLAADTALARALAPPPPAPQG